MSVIALPSRLPYPTQKPHNPRERQRAKAMTIAAGFRCANGVVLCADTQITQVGGKSYKSKILPVNREEDCFLVYAGDVDFVREFTADLKQIVAGKTGKELAIAIKKHYRDFHRQHYTYAPKGEKAFAQIILTVRESKHMHLYAANGMSFYPVDDYESFGSGKPMTEPFFNKIEFRRLSILETANTAIYTLWRIKDFAEWVGGDTKILTIEDGDSFFFPLNCEWSEEEIQSSEEDYQFLDKSLQPLLINYPTADVDQLGKQLRLITGQLKSFRNKKIKKEQREKDKMRNSWEKEAS